MICYEDACPICFGGAACQRDGGTEVTTKERAEMEGCRTGGTADKMNEKVRVRMERLGGFGGGCGS